MSCIGIRIRAVIVINYTILTSNVRNDTPVAVVNMKDICKLVYAHQNPTHAEALVVAVQTCEGHAVTVTLASVLRI